MYLPRHFASDDLARLDLLADHDPFATLITVIDDEPFASHLPVRLTRDGSSVTVRGHWARPNPQWKRLGAQHALCVLHGPHAYVSPRMYPDPSRRVPTWNYAVAHLRGPLRLIEEPGALLELVGELSAHFEAGAPDGWSLAGADRSVDAMAAGIVGFEMTVERIDLKFKLNQNHPVENVESAARALAASDDRDARTIAGWMAADVKRRRPAGG
jgi:transcriptional regulator